jgi:recombination protein U
MANYLENEITNAFTALDWHGGKLAVIRHRQPYDFWALVNGTYYAFEAKSTKLLSSFPFDRLVDHQQEGLLRCSKEGGKAYVVISFRSKKVATINRKTKKKRLVLKRDVVAYAIKIQDWIKIRNDLKLERESIPEDYFETRREFIKLEKTHINGSLVWDLRKIL